MEGRGGSVSALPVLMCEFHIIVGNTGLHLKVQQGETRNGVGIAVLLGFPQVLVPSETSGGDFQPWLIIQSHLGSF